MSAKTDTAYRSISPPDTLSLTKTQLLTAQRAQSTETEQAANS